MRTATRTSCSLPTCHDTLSLCDPTKNQTMLTIQSSYEPLLPQHAVQDPRRRHATETDGPGRNALAAAAAGQPPRQRQAPALLLHPNRWADIISHWRCGAFIHIQSLLLLGSRPASGKRRHSSCTPLGEQQSVKSSSFWPLCKPTWRLFDERIQGIEPHCILQHVPFAGVSFLPRKKLNDCRRSGGAVGSGHDQPAAGAARRSGLAAHLPQHHPEPHPRAGGAGAPARQWRRLQTGPR